MSGNSEKVLSALAERQRIMLSDLPELLDLSYRETVSAVTYLKKQKKVTTVPYMLDLRFSIVVLNSE